MGHLRGLLGVGLDPVVDSFEDVHFGGTERVPKVRKNDFEYNGASFDSELGQIFQLRIV